MGQSLRTLKGVGEKTEKLFWKVGIYDTDDLLHYYPRNYDEYETPVDIAELKEGTVQAGSAAVCSGVYVNSVKGNGTSRLNNIVILIENFIFCTTGKHRSAQQYQA